jgi:hypothetical protein
MAKIFEKRRRPKLASANATVSNATRPAATHARFRFFAAAIILGDRSMAVSVPRPSFSHTSGTAKPWPHPISSTWSEGLIFNVSTAQTIRSGMPLAGIGRYRRPNRRSMSASFSST